MFSWPSLATIDTRVDSRAATFENPSGGRGVGGQAAEGRKGAAFRVIAAGERVALLDTDGPGVVRHVWMTFPPAPPEMMRALWIEATYDRLEFASVSAPCLDFFGLPHGRPVPYASALTTAQEGRGFNAYIPMPFREHVRVDVVNTGATPVVLYYQIDYTLESVPDDCGLLHVSFRRENPTTLRRDFVITEGVAGPGRFLGAVVGVRVIDDGTWYGEGEVKMYVDGDRERSGLPTICGTGLEDYVGSAWGMGAHHAPWSGAPLVVQGPDRALPDFVAFYRWHGPDPVVFRHDLTVTIQQLGFTLFPATAADAFARVEPLAAGTGWLRPRGGDFPVMGVHERIDDYCATAFVYSTTPQPAPAGDGSAATADIGRLAYEMPLPLEGLLG